MGLHVMNIAENFLLYATAPFTWNGLNARVHLIYKTTQSGKKYLSKGEIEWTSSCLSPNMVSADVLVLIKEYVQLLWVYHF